jgi:hypothetical protein
MLSILQLDLKYCLWGPALYTDPPELCLRSR